MHPTQRALAFVERNVALDHPRVQPASLEFSLTKAACEKSALVWVLFHLDYKSAWELRLAENQ